MQTAVGTQSAETQSAERIETQGISGLRWSGHWRISLAGLLKALCCEKHLPHATWRNDGFGGDGKTQVFGWSGPCVVR